MIVIPMAGLSRRFTLAGYTLPKYMLPIGDRTVFAHAVESFSALFKTTPFLFIARDVAGTDSFLRQQCEQLGIADARIVMLDHETAGQADTVLLGLGQHGVVDHEPLTIFNIDTFRAGFAYPDQPWFRDSDGYLEVFRGSGANWSYVEPDPAEPALARRTAEKQQISDLCCDGLYHFARVDDFRFALERERIARSSPELYVAPLYNHLIRRGQRIHYDVIAQDLITFCGVPDEYRAVVDTIERPGLSSN